MRLEQTNRSLLNELLEATEANLRLYQQQGMRLEQANQSLADELDKLVFVKAFDTDALARDGMQHASATMATENSEMQKLQLQQQQLVAAIANETDKLMSAEVSDGEAFATPVESMAVALASDGEQYDTTMAAMEVQKLQHQLVETIAKEMNKLVSHEAFDREAFAKPVESMADALVCGGKQDGTTTGAVEVQELQQQLAEAESALQALQFEIENLKGHRATTSTAEVQKLQQQLVEAQSAMQALEFEVENQKGHRALQQQAAEQSCATLRKQLDDQQREMETARQTEAGLRQQLDELMRDSQRQQEALAEQRQLVRDLEQRSQAAAVPTERQELLQLQHELADRESRLQNFDALQQELVDSRALVRQKEDDRKTQEAKANRAEAELQQLRETIDQLRNERSTGPAREVGQTNVTIAPMLPQDSPLSESRSGSTQTKTFSCALPPQLRRDEVVNKTFPAGCHYISPSRKASTLPPQLPTAPIAYPLQYHKPVTASPLQQRSAVLSSSVSLPVPTTQFGRGNAAPWTRSTSVLYSSAAVSATSSNSSQR